MNAKSRSEREVKNEQLTVLARQTFPSDPSHKYNFRHPEWHLFNE